MENKYYIPKIEEFCLGFKYEYKNGILWTPMSFGFDLLNLFPESPLKNEVRVKILDEQDILDCGFIKQLDYYKLVTKQKVCGENGFYLKECIKCNNNIYVILKYSWQELEGKEEVVFKGRIRNKSDFKKILTYIIA